MITMPDYNGWALSASKAAQILLPLAVVLLFQAMPWHRTFLRWLAAWPRRSEAETNQAERLGAYGRRIDRLLGLVSWKIGCDFGYFFVLAAPWLGAFTLAGLIPYLVGQYVIYRLLGQKMLMGGLINPLRPETYSLPPLQRCKPVRRAISKCFYEDLNATSPYVPMRRVLLKPVADYLAVVICWSLYTMGLFFVQSGEINWQPFIRFPHAFMIGMYCGGVIAFILGYNLGEILVVPWLRSGALWRGRPRPYWLRSLQLRLGPWRERSGIGLSRAISLFCGAGLVAFIAPTVLVGVEAGANWLQVEAFVHWGRLPQPQLQQITTSMRSAEPPDFTTLQAQYESLAKENP